MTVFIPLTKGKVCKLDLEDYLKLPRGWYAQTCGKRHYAAKRYALKLRLLHREILQAKENEVVDHINGDSLDNRKSNLRTCSNTENVRSQRVRISPSKSSRYKGVTRQFGKYSARITCDRKEIWLGTYHSEEAAAEAYNTKALELFKEYAVLNEVSYDI